MFPIRQCFKHVETWKPWTKQLGMSVVNRKMNTNRLDSTYIDDGDSGSQRKCRLSWLTNSASYEMSPNAGGGVLRGLSQWVQLCTWSPNELWRSNSIFNNLWWFLRRCNFYRPLQLAFVETFLIKHLDKRILHLWLYMLMFETFFCVLIRIMYSSKRYLLR